MFAAIAAGAAVISAGTGIVGSIASSNAAAGNAKAQQAHNEQTFRNQIIDRNRAIDYAEEIFAQDLSFAYENLNFQRGEFARQERILDRNREAIQRNTDWSIGGILMRQLEEDMASTLQELGIGKQAGAMRGAAQVSASARGVEGNSVDAILQDVTRQEGEALATVELNRSVTSRALTRQVIEARTAGTQQMMGQVAQTYAPATPLRVMGPMGSINPSAPVAQPSPLAALAGIGSAIGGGFNLYNSLTKQDPATTFQQIGSIFGIGR